MRAVRYTIILALAPFAVGNINSQESTISLAEAKSLVGIVLRHQQFPLSSPYCEIENLDQEGRTFAPDYYAFSAHCDFPNTAATSPWGTYLVSPRTGDVLQFDFCKWFRYADLRRVQKQIMLRTHATEAAEAQYQEKNGCARGK